ncbi:hypothetical protein ACI1UJ_09975 [Lactococcus petauri]|uniref:hypothetical protein n=1 Tax=Lactococcus petauri TaxID=1940789 RepID=UPI003852B9EA
MRNTGMSNKTIGFIVVILLVIAGIGSACHYNAVENVRGTVTDKVVKIDSTNKHPRSKYLIFVKTESGESVPFEVVDSVLIGRWDSSNDYGMIEIGKTYDFKLRGYRVPIISAYQNLDSYSEVK